MLDRSDNRHGNAMKGGAYHNRNPKRPHRGPYGYSSFKSHDTGSGPGIESPDGYRSRGPSAERQARRLRRLGGRLVAHAQMEEIRVREMLERRKAIKAKVNAAIEARRVAK